MNTVGVMARITGLISQRGYNIDSIMSTPTEIAEIYSVHLVLTETEEKIEQISLLLSGALKANGMVGLKMNIPKDKIDKLINVLPSLTAPTVANLYNTDWFSVETIIAEEKVRELVPALLKEGAEGIIEYPLNKII